ncbi:MAG: HD-like signal output (HDOD) protein [Enterobacterales bacterium]
MDLVKVNVNNRPLRVYQGSILSEKRLFLQIYRDLETGKIELPSLPDLATKIRDTLKDPTTPLEDACKLISVDSSLIAYLIKIANSPLYVGVDKCVDVQGAIIRLGYNNTRNLSMTFVLRSLFRPKLRKLKPILEELWLKVSKLAALSSVLAGRCSGFDPDMALTAGMMQDIGALPIIQKLSRYPDVFNKPDEVQRIIDIYAARVGTLILHKWNFQEDMVEVVRSREDWMRDKAPQADLADIVMIARLHSYVGTPKMRDCPRISAIPAYQKLPFGQLGPSESLLILEEASEEIREIKLLFPTPQPKARKRSMRM